MEVGENQFLVTVLNSPESLKQFLIDNGNRPKRVSPISFFSEKNREKFIRKPVTES